MTSAERRPKALLEPFDGGEIEMVRRLVEQQDVGLGASTRASAAVGPRAGEARGVASSPAEPEPAPE